MSRRSDLEYTGERHIPQEGGAVIALEHEHRYAFAQAHVAGINVLDIGCGEGYGTARLGTAAARVVGLDVDEETIAHAERSYAGKRVHFVVGDAEKLPFGSSSFDACVAFEVIEHVDDPRSLLREARRVLRPEGLLLASTPNAALAHEADPEVNPFHRRVLSVEEFRELLAFEFPSHLLLGQRVSGASFIWPLGERPGQLEDLGALTTTAFGAKYLIGLGRAEGLHPPRNHEATIYGDAENRVVNELERFWVDLGWARPRLDAFEREIALANDERATLAREADVRQGEIERLGGMLTDLARERLSTETAFAEALGELASTRAKLEEADAGGIRLSSKIDHLRELSERLRSELDQVRADLERRQLEHHDAQLELERTKLDLERVLSELQETTEYSLQVRGQLGGVLESRSWRITRPLRRLRRSARPELESLEKLEERR